MSSGALRMTVTAATFALQVIRATLKLRDRVLHRKSAIARDLAVTCKQRKVELVTARAKLGRAKVGAYHRVMRLVRVPSPCEQLATAHMTDRARDTFIGQRAPFGLHLRKLRLQRRVAVDAPV